MVNQNITNRQEENMELNNLIAQNLEREYNRAKSILLYFLEQEGILSSKQLEYYVKNYAIIVKEPGFFSKLWSSKAGGRQLIVVKQQTISESGTE
jgi:hypothetical protein